MSLEKTRGSDYASWELEEGVEIQPGRIALRRLGGGSRYEVYLAWDEALHALAVAKLLRPDRVEEERSLRELGEEAEILARLAHPVLVRGFDAVLEGARPHLLIEHLEGPSLRRLIRKGGPASLEQLLPLGVHLAGVLHYMAGAGAVHLDVKPDNIVMGVPPRLIDLSIARTVERAARTRGPLGTDAYMAPEQCGGPEPRGEMGPPADVWGLGATLYHAASGRTPFPRGPGARESADPLERFPQLTSDPDPLPRSLPDELRELVLEMLSPDPVTRPRATDVVARLEPLVAVLPRKLRFSRRAARGA